MSLNKFSRNFQRKYTKILYYSPYCIKNYLNITYNEIADFIYFKTN